MIASFEKVTKTYYNPLLEKELLILDQVDWQIEKGLFISITGKSGSGKSTLFNILSSLDTPEKGQVNSCGFDLIKAREEDLALYRNRCIGLIFQQHYLLRDFTALENVLIPTLIAGNKDRERACYLLESVGLSERLHHYPHQLSGGEQQRVALARALINRPLLLLADEPTGNLDGHNAQRVQKLLLRLQKEDNLTLVAVTHDEDWAKQADARYLLEKAQLKRY